MRTTHVFIVDTNTFKYHVEYLFAGTGAKDSFIDFNNSPETRLNHQTENNLVAMLADSQRIRKGDYIIFYLQQKISEKVYDGKFYGIFKAKENLSFLDNNDKKQFLREELKKSLTFRTLITPFEVYPEGVTEWEALDEIKYIQSPNQMLWSLIYRKLKGNRGNTMITIYESERLFKLIRDKNRREKVDYNQLTFDPEAKKIKRSDKKLEYTGRKTSIDIRSRLINKYEQKKAFEAHLQAYIVQILGRRINKDLDIALIGDNEIEWIGNEVSCGVGMQRIDVMLSLTNEEARTVVPIELKSVKVSENNIFQIQRYVNWLEQYYIPNRISDIQPALVAKKYQNKESNSYKKTLNSFREFNEKNKNCLPLKYIEYENNNGEISFCEISY